MFSGITGYLQGEFQLVIQKNASFAVSSLTKDGFSFEIRILHYAENKEIQVGDYLQVTGRVQMKKGIF